MLYIQVNRRTLGRVSKPAAQLEEELETTDDDDDEDLILCRYSAAESTGVSGTVGSGSKCIPCMRLWTGLHFRGVLAFHTGTHELGAAACRDEGVQ